MRILLGADLLIEGHVKRVGGHSGVFLHHGDELLHHIRHGNMLKDRLAWRLPEAKVQPVDEANGCLGPRAFLKPFGRCDVEPDDTVMSIDLRPVVLNTA
eukprot:scaffold93465_cov53-Prasinocladus_malaysianus.AAC.3